MKNIKKHILILAVTFIGLSLNAQDTFIIRSAINNSLVLSTENNSESLKANVQIKTYNRKKTQQWVVVPSVERRYFYLKSKASNYVLDVKNGSRAIRTPVWMYAPTNNDAQKWEKIPAGNGYFYLKSKLGTYLDVKGGANRSETPVWTYSLNRSKAQKWKFDPTDPSYRVPSRCVLSDCTEVQRGTVGVSRNRSGKYDVSSASGTHFTAPNYAEAQKIKRILFDRYQIDRYCTFEKVVFPYRDDNLITAGVIGEDCILFNPLNLSVQKRNGKWIIKDGRENLLRASSKGNALKMICLIKKMGVRKICFVGRPDPSIIYVRK